MNNKPLTEGHYDMLTIIGPTASGKTELAVAVARMLDGEIISGDSRQIYRGMTLGTGKDLDDYSKGGETVKYHLIDIADAGERYNIYDYQKDFLKAYNDIKSRGKLPILCGGSGMYVECILKGSCAGEQTFARQPARQEPRGTNRNTKGLRQKAA